MLEIFARIEIFLKLYPAEKSKVIKPFNGTILS